MPVFSKPLDKASVGTNKMNSRHRAPIPLYTERQQGAEGEATIHGDHGDIKLKLRRNPAVNNSPTYEKYYKPFDGQTAEEYYEFRFMFAEVEHNMPLNTAAQKFAQITGLLAGTCQTNWDSCVANLTPAQMDTDEGFTAAIDEFALNFADRYALWSRSAL